MQASELRIGSITNRGKVTALPMKLIMSDWDVDCDNFSYSLDEIEPIPLTEEWLIRLGFTLDNEEPFFWYDRDKISISFNENRMCQELVHSYNQFEIPKYVHQLQNLFFALTGEELVAEPAQIAQTI